MLHQVPERRKQATSQEHNIFTPTDSVTPPPPHIFVVQIEYFVIHFYIFTANITYLPHTKLYLFKIAVKLILCFIINFQHSFVGVIWYNNT